MTAARRPARSAYLTALRAALVLLATVAGLTCAQTSSAAADPVLRQAAHPAPSAAALPHSQHGQHRATEDDRFRSGATASGAGCSGTSAMAAEAPAGTRQDAPAAGLRTPPVPDPGPARVRAGRDAPAPPPHPPSLEALSVRRV